MRIGDGGRADEPVGVVSAVVLDGARPGRTLLGVRRRRPLAARHPGVLSTPTLRLPAELFGLLTAGYEPIEQPGLVAVAGETVGLGGGGHLGSPTAFALEALLARKLGLADAIGDGRFHATARPRMLSLDHVEDPLGTQTGEWTVMITYELRVTRGVDTIPGETGSYSRLVWVDTAKLPTAVAHRDALLLDETLDAVEVCIHGLCIRVAAQIVLSPGQAS